MQSCVHAILAMSRSWFQTPNIDFLYDIVIVPECKRQDWMAKIAIIAPWLHAYCCVFHRVVATASCCCCGHSVIFSRMCSQCIAQTKVLNAAIIAVSALGLCGVVGSIGKIGFSNSMVQTDKRYFCRLRLKFWSTLIFSETLLIRFLWIFHCFPTEGLGSKATRKAKALAWEEALAYYAMMKVPAIVRVNLKVT